MALPGPPPFAFSEILLDATLTRPSSSDGRFFFAPSGSVDFVFGEAPCFWEGFDFVFLLAGPSDRFTAMLLGSALFPFDCEVLALPDPLAPLAARAPPVAPPAFFGRLPPPALLPAFTVLYVTVRVGVFVTAGAGAAAVRPGEACKPRSRRIEETWPAPGRRGRVTVFW